MAECNKSRKLVSGTFYIAILTLLLSPTVAPTLSSAKDVVSLSSLLESMVDREDIARLPSPAYKCSQFSSYDRRSTNPETPDTWFANWDRSQFVRIEETDGRKEYVMMDAAGPGCIVRIWGTWHGPKGEPFSDGTLRIYLDGSEQPVIEGPITEVLDGGKLVGPPLAQGVSPQTDYARRGHNLYLPIPYGKQCKVTYETEVPVDVGGKKGEALYYQINYRTYEAGTNVETFSLEALAAHKSKVEEVQATLLSRNRRSKRSAATTEWNGTLPANGSAVVAQFDSGTAIERLSLKFPNDVDPQTLRSTVLKIEFDGKQTVWAPVGDFFGAGYQPRAFNTWYTSYSDDGVLACEWVMPFKESCKVTLENLQGRAVEIANVKITTADWSWDKRSMHFHTTWRQYSDIDTGGEKTMDKPNGVTDVNYVAIEGSGVYVGDTLTLFNGAARWWGEGDEKIYVDGERFPSHFGTGTEDYYGYAWCRPESFDAPFHAQPEGGGNLEGGFSVNSRYRSLDAIPFKSKLKFDMELWHWAPTTMNYAPATFFYARPGASTNVKPDPAEAKMKVQQKDAVASN